MKIEQKDKPLVAFVLGIIGTFAFFLALAFINAHMQ